MGEQEESSVTPGRDDVVEPLTPGFGKVEASSRSRVRRMSDRTSPITGSGPRSCRDSQRKPPKHFGRYEIIEEVARGTYGVVYRARDPKLRREIALKVLLSEGSPSEEELRRFRLEAHAAARLRHPNIVPIHEMGEHEGRHYFTLDFVEGTDLREVIASKPPAARIVRIIRDVAEGVHYAHEKGIIHRDLKPGNILVDKSGHAMVTDFGLARHVQADSSLTQAGDVIGTPTYMSPEQALGEVTNIDERSDVYALGVILYELLTGRPPFLSKNLPALLAAVVQKDAVPPRKRDTKLDRDLETIVMKCLEKDRNRRYRTAGALAEDLRRFGDGAAINARPASVLYRARKFTNRNRWPMALVGVLLLAFAAFGAWQLKLYRDQWAGWDLVYQDTFDGSKLSERWRVLNGTWRVKDGHLEGAGTDNGYLLLEVPVKGDVRVDFRARCIPDERFQYLEAGVFCNASKKRLDEDGYFGSLGNAVGVQLQRHETHVSSNRETQAEPGRWYDIRLERSGWELKFFVDEELVARLSDPVPVTGGIGRDLTGLYLFKAHTWFDDLRVYRRGSARTVSVLETGNVLFDRGHYDEAAEVYDNIRRNRPGTTEALAAGYRKALCCIEVWLARKSDKSKKGKEEEEESANLLSEAEKTLIGLRAAGREPWTQFAQAALADIEYFRGHYVEALELAADGADQDRVLQDAIRPFLTKYWKRFRWSREDLAAECKKTWDRLFPGDPIDVKPVELKPRGRRGRPKRNRLQKDLRPSLNQGF